MSASAVAALVRDRIKDREYLVAVLLACLLLGSYGLLVASPSAATSQQLHPAVLVTWYVALVVGPTLALVGLAFRDPLGLALHLGGLAVLIPATWSYAAAVMQTYGAGGLAAGGVWFLISGAHMRRAYVTGRALHAHYRRLRSAREVAQRLAGVS